MPGESWVNVYPAGSSVLQSSRSERSRAWSNTLNYPSVRRDDLPVNTYSDYQQKGDSDIVTALKIRKSTGAVEVHGNFGYQKSTSSYGCFMYLDAAPPHRSDASMLNETLVKALGKVADAKTNLAVMYAEKAKTSQLILESANRIYRAMRAFRRGRFKEVAQILNLHPKTVHKTWLEYKYGWTPLLMDVKNSAEFFAQQVVPRPLRFSVSAKTEDPIEWIYQDVGFNRSGFDTNLETMEYVTSQDNTCRVKLWCEISNPHLSQLQQLGITNPALVAWELVPYSFVFDWFIQVGDWLQALSALHGVTVRKAMVSHKKAVIGRSTEQFNGYDGFYHTYLPWTIKRNAQIRNYVRSPLAVNQADLYPPVDLSLPKWQKMVTAIALMRSNSRSFGTTRV